MRLSVRLRHQGWWLEIQRRVERLSQYSGGEIMRLEHSWWLWGGMERRGHSGSGWSAWVLPFPPSIPPDRLALCSSPEDRPCGLHHPDHLPLCFWLSSANERDQQETAEGRTGEQRSRSFFPHPLCSHFFRTSPRSWQVIFIHGQSFSRAVPFLWCQLGTTLYKAGMLSYEVRFQGQCVVFFPLKSDNPGPRTKGQRWEWLLLLPNNPVREGLLSLGSVMMTGCSGHAPGSPRPHTHSTTGTSQHSTRTKCMPLSSVKEPSPALWELVSPQTQKSRSKPPTNKEQ